MARLAARSLDLNQFIFGKNFKDNFALDCLFSKALIERSSRGTDNIIGAVIHLPCADSYAIYIVVKARPLTLMHVSLSDAWSVPGYQINGLRKADIEQMRIGNDGRGFFGLQESKATDTDREFVVQKLQALLPEVFDGTALEPLKAKA
jgi:hypothetical protein